MTEKRLSSAVQLKPDSVLIYKPVCERTSMKNNIWITEKKKKA